jgi:hypothetical protein
MSYFKNLIVDLLSTNTPSGDLINWLPASLRKKARENLKARTVVAQRLPSGNIIYRRLTAREWSQG